MPEILFFFQFPVSLESGETFLTPVMFQCLSFLYSNLLFVSKTLAVTRDSQLSLVRLFQFSFIFYSSLIYDKKFNFIFSRRTVRDYIFQFYVRCSIPKNDKKISFLLNHKCNRSVSYVRTMYYVCTIYTTKYKIPQTNLTSPNNFITPHQLYQFNWKTKYTNKGITQDRINRLP